MSKKENPKPTGNQSNSNDGPSGEAKGQVPRMQKPPPPPKEKE